MSKQCDLDCSQHTGEAYAVRVVGLGVSDRVVLCQAARDEQRANGFRVDAVDDDDVAEVRCVSCRCITRAPDSGGRCVNCMLPQDWEVARAEQASRPRIRRPVPLHLSWRLRDLNKLVADAQKTREMNLNTRGRAAIDHRSIGAVDFMLGRIVTELQRVRDGVQEEVAEIERGDEAAQ